MKLVDIKSVRAATTVAALSLFTHSAAGQSVPAADQTPSAPDDNTNTSSVAPAANPVRGGLSLDYGFVAGSDASFQGSKSKSDAQSLTANATVALPLNDQWFVPLRVNTRDFFLGTVADLPIPDRINTLGFDAGLGCRFNDDWTFSAELGPRLYRFDDLSGDDVGVGGIVRATYKWSPTLSVTLGLNFETDREAPVLPAAGLRWDIAPKLALDLMWPRTALVYHANQQLDLYAGGGGTFAVIRTDSSFGNGLGQPAYNNALATYRDFHVGIGAEYRLFHGLSADVEGGVSFGRHIDYTDLDQTVTFAAAPYIQAGLKWRF